MLKRHCCFSNGTHTTTLKQFWICDSINSELYIFRSRRELWTTRPDLFSVSPHIYKYLLRDRRLWSIWIIFDDVEPLDHSNADRNTEICFHKSYASPDEKNIGAQTSSASCPALALIYSSTNKGRWLCVTHATINILLFCTQCHCWPHGRHHS